MQNKILKLTVIISLFTFSVSLKAELDCSSVKEVNGTYVELAKVVALIAEKVSDEENVTLEAATTYLASIGSGVDFKENEALIFINKLTPVCENSPADKTFRSRACTRLSGLHGKMAQKLKMDGISNGKFAYKYLKLALQLDANNKEAIIGHAMTVAELSNQNYFVKKIIESNLEANFADEARYAKANLERVNLTRHPLYQRLSEIN